MNSELLEKILSCKELPSLPAVALRVIELTSNPDVKLGELAATIQNDQGLAAKVLRTVNSSFYGLRTPCASINKALVMLGLAPVKTLALGFSLVSSLNDKQVAGFDYVAYWRRGLYTSVAAKIMAESSGRAGVADEAFLAGLLQDIGMMAMYIVLGREYLGVLERTGGDHSQLMKHELQVLELTHPDIGAMLAERWKLPSSIVTPVRYHERPTAAPKEHVDLCRCVGLGNLVHDVLTSKEPAAPLKELYDRAKQWFLLDTGQVDAIVRRCADGTKELSKLFKLDTGPFADVDAVMTVATTRKQDFEKVAASEDVAMSSLLKDSEDKDPLTGLPPRRTFSATVQGAFGSGGSVALVQVLMDGINAIYAASTNLGDDTVLAVSSALSRHFDKLNAKICRLSPEVFAVVVPNAAPDAVIRALDSVRGMLSMPREGGTPVAVSVGVAVADPAQGEVRTPTDLVVAATKALQSAKHGGGNRVSVHAAKAA